ncbi:uncharacterized protein LOC135950501 [Calliphora vicina]|uniref:uncharacterized protein LOC135950501 n=1 Tax=Calliphora vicina TaxID=7373 RepID=UPI00325B3E80
MSIATEQLQQSFHNPNRQKQQSARTFTHKEPLKNRIKSIDTTIESQVEHVTKKVIKSKQLLRQPPVAATEAEEVKPEDKKSQSQETDDINVKELEETNLNEHEEEDVCEAKDYQVYQNGRVNEFFQNEMLEKPKNISDICLVNDHYILVKMPQQEITSTNNNLAETAAAARRKEFRALKEHNDKLLKESEKDKKKLCRYLRRNRNCITRIAPIHEEPEELSDNENKTVKTNSKLYCLKMRSCWQASEQEVETYQTKTKICKSIKNNSLETSCNQQIQSNNKQSSPSKPATEIHKCVNTHNPPDIQTISGTILKSSLQYQVSLHNYGSLIDSSNNNNSNLEIINSPPRRKCPRFESFYWLLRPFRGKYRKTKPKIQAVVYKTYFVKWTKPPDTLSHGYGVKSSKSSDVEVSVLRRCRSAIF